MPHSPILCLPSLLSVTSSTTQAAKKGVKLVKNAVKHDAAAISCLFMKCHKLSSSGGSAEGDLGKCFFSYSPVFTYVYITVNDVNSTRSHQLSRLTMKMMAIP